MREDMLNMLFSYLALAKRADIYFLNLRLYLFSPFDFVVYMAAPIVALILRMAFLFRKTAKRARIF